MCIQNALQQHILNITNDGKTVADFFHATMQGETYDAKTHHRMEAAKQLAKLGLPITPSPLMGEGRDGGESPVHPELVEGHAQENTPSPSTGEEPAPSEGRGWDGGENSVHPELSQAPNHPTENCELKTENRPVTDLDIINYETAHLIREETNDGYAIAEFLARVMRGSSPGEMEYSHKDRIISAADRMAAAKELMNRGFGKFGDSRRRLSNSQDDRELIQSGLSRYIRERTEYGMEAARFLLDVASGQDEGFSMHQRVVATRELVRRGWDTNYDAITPDDIVAYYQRQDALEPTEYDNRLQEWRESLHPVGVTGRSPEEEPQLESGLFAHLTEAEITRYEAMSAEEQTEFTEEQRERRAAAAQPDSAPVIPAQAEIHTPDTPDNSNNAETQSETETDESNQDLENTDWNILIQDIGVPLPKPHPVHPVRSRTRIRSP